LEVLGAFILCFKKPIDEKELENVKELLKAVGKVAKGGMGWGWDGALLAVGIKASVTPVIDLNKSTEEWEDICREEGGWEWIDAEAKGRNEYGEPVGIPRLREALEANDWAGNEGVDGEIESFLNSDGEENEEVGFNTEAAQLEREMFGIRSAIYGKDGKGRKIGEDEDEDDEEIKVEELEAMMMRMHSVKG
jgi:Alpha and gamma adaptin binding protein p34